MVTTDIELWFCDFSKTHEAVFSALTDRISPVETQKLASLVRTESRQQKIVSRALLQYAVGYYLSHPLKPEDLLFPKDAAPRLASSATGADLVLSLSHSGTGVLVAVSCQSKLGIDILDDHRPRKWARLADVYFTSAEKALLNTISPADAPARFRILWCLKEALAKADGTNLFDALDHDFSPVLEKTFPLQEASLHWHKKPENLVGAAACAHIDSYTVGIVASYATPTSINHITAEGLLASLSL